MNDMNEMLEFQQIKEMLKAYAMTEKARERLEALKPYLDQTRAEAAVRSGCFWKSSFFKNRGHTENNTGGTGGHPAQSGSAGGNPPICSDVHTPCEISAKMQRACAGTGGLCSWSSGSFLSSGRN